MTQAASRRPRTARRVALAVVLLVVGLELGYLAVANLVLATNVARNLANQRPEVLSMSYRSAFTPWPGRVYARDLAIRFQDPNVAFSLSMSTSRIDVALFDLFSRKFRATHARGTNVSYRMLLKVDSTAGIKERVAAFPPIDGVASPPVRPAGDPEPPLSQEEIDRLWSLEFHDIDSDISEVWLFEYRYQGKGHSRGSFGIEPMKRVWVGPVTLALEAGTLSLGPHLISEGFSFTSEATLAPIDISSPPGVETFNAITGTAQIELPLDSLEFATVYLPGAIAKGAGTVSAEVKLESGNLEPGTKLTVNLPKVAGGYRGVGFSGVLRGGLTVTDKAVATAAAEGKMTFPLPEDAALNATVHGVTGRLSLASTDLGEGVRLGRLHGGVEKVEATDARPLVDLAASKVPIFARAILGEGPLTAAGTVDSDGRHTVLRISSATLGAADLRGAIGLLKSEWFGAAEGHAGDVTVGVEVDNGKVSVVPLPPPFWLETQLTKYGINPLFRTVR